MKIKTLSIFLLSTVLTQNAFAQSEVIKDLEKARAQVVQNEDRMRSEEESMALSIDAAYTKLKEAVEVALKTPTPELLNEIMKLSAKMLANDPSGSAGEVLVKVFNKYPKLCDTALKASVSKAEQAEILECIKFTRREELKGNG